MILKHNLQDWMKEWAEKDKIDMLPEHKRVCLCMCASGSMCAWESETVKGREREIASEGSIKF